MTSRRAVLAGLTTAVLSVAGCSELYGGPDDPDRDGDVQDDDRDVAVQQLEAETAEDPLLSLAEREGEEAWRVVAYGHVAEIATVSGHGDHHWVDVALTDDGWASFHDGFADANVFESAEDFLLRTHLGGEIVFTGPIPEHLVAAIEEGDWAGALRVSAGTREQAEEIAAEIEAD